jgi:spore germination protein YaaH
MYLLPAPKKSGFLQKLQAAFKNIQTLIYSQKEISQRLSVFWQSKKNRYRLAIAVDLICLVLVLLNGIAPASRIISPLVSNYKGLQPITENKGNYEVFGFAPFWTFSKLDNVDFKTLTTLAYFGLEVYSDGTLENDGPGYETFHSKKATEVFKKAHANGTRVVLTITQMQNSQILAIMDDPQAQERTINQTVDLVKQRGIDGINVDFEYMGDPGQDYRDKFSIFVENMAQKLHKEVPGSKITVSVYASAVKDPKIYDIAALGKSTDGIFMMAYDFAVAKSDNAIPTSPLYGHKEGKYWYDIATAVEDFTKLMDPDKLILGVPYYGYNYLVYEPGVKAETRPYYSWRGTARAQTYTLAQDITPGMNGITEYKEGWDDYGKVSWKAYHVAETDTWRMIFLDDRKSLGIKYDFAKEKGLKGVGMWALGFDDGKNELWGLLAEKFGDKNLASRPSLGEINE